MARQSSKVTKRRKVWVQYFDGANKLLFGPRRVSDYKRPGFVPFLERLPSDVVLSREDVARLHDLLTGEAGKTLDTERLRLAVALLLRSSR